jgi:hypothetical protein
MWPPCQGMARHAGQGGRPPIHERGFPPSVAVNRGRGRVPEARIPIGRPKALVKMTRHGTSYRSAPQFVAALIASYHALFRNPPHWPSLKIGFRAQFSGSCRLYPEPSVSGYGLGADHLSGDSRDGIRSDRLRGSAERDRATPPVRADGLNRVRGLDQPDSAEIIDDFQNRPTANPPLGSIMPQ